MFRAICISLLLGACNFRMDKAPRGPNEYNQSQGSTKGAVASFAEVSAKVLGPRCAECHSDFGEYAAVRASLSEIRTLVAANTMPKDRPILSDAEKGYLFAWIDAGASEFAGAPTPPPQEPLPAIPSAVLPPAEVLNFALVKARVLDLRCVRCHGTRGDVNLETYANVVFDLARIKSSVESDFMPIREPLSDEQKQLLFRWIEIGAPEN